jgi:hypothetical protein
MGTSSAGTVASTADRLHPSIAATFTPTITIVPIHAARMVADVEPMNSFADIDSCLDDRATTSPRMTSRLSGYSLGAIATVPTLA